MTKEDQKMDYQAHRGVCTEAPENTLPAFVTAAEQGYTYWEVDPRFTADGQCVLLHDSTLNRTCRHADGTEISEELRLSALTLEQVWQYDAGLAFSYKFRGTKIPLLADVLRLAKENNAVVKLDNIVEKMTLEQREKLFSLVEQSGAKVGFTCTSFDFIRAVSARFPCAEIHYDGAVTDETLLLLSALGLPNPLTVWLCLPCEATDWVKVPKAERSLCEKVKKFARPGLWILSDETQLKTAEEYGADLVETPGQLKPLLPFDGLADCHTHSFCSHDSQCDPADMSESERKNGVSCFAVTDHCDIEFCRSMDVRAPIQKSFEIAKALQKKTPGRVMTGVEIGEAIRFPDEADAVIQANRFDVVLGSVHAVDYPGYTQPYSQIDFSVFTEEQLAEYLSAYFRDMKEMVLTTDFDILTHLTCPLRYIVGKYHRKADLTPYAEKIDEILRLIIRRGIALECNTSGFDGEMPLLMPDESVLRRYYALGGRLVTLGSDAHRADRAANGFNEAVRLLERIGFTYACRFRERIALPYKLKTE